MYLRRILICLAVVIFCVISHNFAKPKIALLNVGQGLSVFIQDEFGTQILYDGGPGQSVLAELSKVMPPWDNSIDILILSHTHQDHIEGLIEILRRYKVRKIWWSNASAGGDIFANFVSEIQKSGVQVRNVSRGDKYNLLSGLNFEALFPNSTFDQTKPDHAHDANLVFNVETPDKKNILLTGDLNNDNEKDLLRNCQLTIVDCPTKIDILQVSHHGSRETTTDEFLDQFKITTAWIGVGEDNKYNHPHEETLERLAKQNIKIKRTDLDGTVILDYNEINPY